MSTTTIRLTNAMKARVAAAAERAGKTPHAFILDTIEQTVEQAERRADFQRVADERWAGLLDNGKTISLEAAGEYFAARASGRTPVKPKARKLSR